MLNRHVLLFAALTWAGLAHAQHASLPSGMRFVRAHEANAHGGFDVDAVTVDLCDGSLAPRVSAPTEGARTVSAWARDVNALAAVNGDYFDGRSMQPLGPARGAGHDWSAPRREHRDTLFAFDHDAQPHLLDAPDTAQPTVWLDANARLDAAWPDVIAVRERVLRDGVVRESPAIVHDGERHPRTALGLSADRHTLFLAVVDGRAEHSSGATTDELARAMLHLGARDAFKLDGGGSSTLFVRGRGVVNHPSDGHERFVANHIGIVATAGPATRRAWCGAAPSHASHRGLPASAYLVLMGTVAVAMRTSARRSRRS